MDRRFAHRRGRDERAAVAHPGDRDRNHAAAVLARDPALADGMGDVEGAVHHDIGDRVEAARRQVLGARDEVAGGVVDEPRQRTATENSSTIASTAAASRMSTP